MSDHTLIQEFVVPVKMSVLFVLICGRAQLVRRATCCKIRRVCQLVASATHLWQVSVTHVRATAKIAQTLLSVRSAILLTFLKKALVFQRAAQGFIKT